MRRDGVSEQLKERDATDRGKGITGHTGMRVNASNSMTGLETSLQQLRGEWVAVKKTGRRARGQRISSKERSGGTRERQGARPAVSSGFFAHAMASCILR